MLPQYQRIVDTEHQRHGKNHYFYLIKKNKDLIKCCRKNIGCLKRRVPTKLHMSYLVLSISILLVLSIKFPQSSHVLYRVEY